MPFSAKRKLVVGATGLAVLAGAGGAYAAAQGSPTPTPTTSAAKIDPAGERDAFLDDLAKRLNVTRDQLEEAIKGAVEARIDAAVAAGRLTDEQAERLKERLENGRLPLLGPGPIGAPGGPRGGVHRQHHGRGPGLGLDAAADYLGLSEQQLHERLRDGKSLADIAKERNRSVDGLKQALKKAFSERLDEAVEDKRLTEEQKNRMLERLDDRLDAIVTRSFTPRWR